MKLLKDYLKHLSNNNAGIWAIVFSFALGTISYYSGAPLSVTGLFVSVGIFTIVMDLYTMERS